MLQINEDTFKIITKCNNQLNLPDGKLLQILTSIAKLIKDSNYLQQLLNINHSINNIAEVN